MYWKLVGRTNLFARCLADKHYSRKSPGAAEFCPPGDNIVLLGLKNDALWVSHRPNPHANLKRPRFDGMDYWDNPYFRNESGKPSSDLIYDALAITNYLWGSPPLDGFHSFIDPKKVESVRWNGIEQPCGFSYWLAGFMRYPKVTQEKKLFRYILTSERLTAIKPIEPIRGPVYVQPILVLTA